PTMSGSPMTTATTNNVTNNGGILRPLRYGAHGVACRADGRMPSDTRSDDVGFHRHVRRIRIHRRYAQEPHALPFSGCHRHFLIAWGHVDLTSPERCLDRQPRA